MHQLAFLQQPARHVLRMQLRRLGHVAEQAAQRAGAAHAVPLVAQAPGGEREGIARIARLGHGLEHGGEAGLAVGGGEHAVFVEAGAAAWRGKGHCCGVLQQRVVEAGDVEVAAAGGFAVFQPDGFGRGVAEDVEAWPRPAFPRGRGGRPTPCAASEPLPLRGGLGWGRSPVRQGERASSRRAKSTAISQSCRLLPGLARCARAADAPLAVGDRALFSPQVVAGSSRSAYSQVAVVAKASCTTTNSARCSARRTVAWSGMDCAGLVQAIHSALICRRPRPGTSPPVAAGFGTEGTPHSAATSARCCGLASSRWADSRLARPPTRPPIALGCPVSENGPAPGRPIWPVARCRLISAAFLAVPLLDWFSPWQYRLSVAGEVANHCAR